MWVRPEEHGSRMTQRTGDLGVMYSTHHINTTAADFLFESQHLYFAINHNEMGAGLAQSAPSSTCGYGRNPLDADRWDARG